MPLVLVSWLVRHYGRQVHDRYEEVQAQLAEMNALVQENLAGARVVRAYTQEAQEEARFAVANEEYVSRNRRLVWISGILHPGIGFLMGLGSLTVLWLGGRMVVASTITLGEFVAFGVVPRHAQLADDRPRLGGEPLRARRGLDAPHPRDPRRARPRSATRTRCRSGEIRGDVEFRSLSFAYDGAAVLRDVDLRVPAGTTVAIVGPTGSGKSTLVSLLPRLFDAPPGTLFVDGHDVRRIPLATLRGAVGFVPQESFLFSATVRENVAFGAGRGRAAPEWAAGIAQLAKDVRDFPRGFETTVGERGITLSGGQKQRTALARALAVDPRILVLDDALSAVDTETEEQILDGLREVMRARTTFLVSHRVSTVKEADLIVVLREGRIVERGTHDELVAAGRLLRRPPPAAAARGRDRDRRGRGVSAPDDDALAPPSYDFRLLRRLLGYLRPHLAAVAAAFALIVAQAGIDLVGPYLTKVAIDRHIAKGDAAGLARVAGLYLLALAAAFVVRFLQNYIMQMAGQRIMQDMRREIFAHLQRLHVGYFDRTRWAAS